MKNILAAVLLLVSFCATAQFNPSDNGKIAIPTPMGLNYAGPLDGRSMFYDAATFKYRPYTDTTEVWNYLNQPKFRSGLFPIVVNTGGSLSGGVITGGTNALWFYKDGTARNNLVRMITPFDSTGLSNRINRKVDTTYMLNDSVRRVVINGFAYDQLQKGSPYFQQLDPTYFDTLANGALTWVGPSGTSISSSFKNVASMLAATRPADSSIVACSGFYTPGDCPTIYLQWFASSTTTTNGMSIFGSGTGRYKRVYMNSETTLKQLGIFPASDNTVAVNAAGVLCGDSITLRPDINSTYIVDPNAGGWVWFSKLKVIGYGNTSVIKSKAYTSQGKGLIYKLPANSADTLQGGTIQSVTLDGNTIYTNSLIDAASPVKDTTGSIVYMQQVNNFSIKYCNIINGGSYSAIHAFKAYNSNFDDNFFDNTGTALEGNYDTTSINNSFRRNKIHRIAPYDLWDGAAIDGNTGLTVPNRREGNDWICGFGKNMYVEDNEVWNEYGHIMFGAESRQILNAVYRRNKVHAGMSSYGGYSIGGNITDGKLLNGFTFQGNIADSVYQRPLRARDSTVGVNGTGLRLKYLAGSTYNEFGLLNGADISNNTLPLSQLSLGNSNKNVNIHDNVFDNTTVIPNYPVSGSGSEKFFSPTLHNYPGTVDTVQNVNYYNNTNFQGQGEFMVLTPDGAISKSLHIYNNNFFFNSGALMELYKPHGPNWHRDLSFNNNTVNGSNSYYWIFTTDSTVSTTQNGIGVNFTDNHLKNSTFDTISNFVTNLSGAPIGFNREGTEFTTGKFSRHMDSVSLSGSNLITWKNGQANTSVALPSGGGGTPGNPTGTVGLTAVNGTAPTYLRSDVHLPIDSTKIATAFSVLDTALVLRARYNLPAPTPLGNIFYKTIFPNAFDFTNNGTITTTPQTNGSIRIGGGAGTFTAYTTYSNYTLVPKWKAEAYFKLTTVNGTSYGIGIGKKSTDAVTVSDVLGRVITVSGGTADLYINTTSGTQLATTVGPSFSANDSLYLTAEFKDSVFTVTVKNMTTNSATTTLSYTYTPTGYFLPNTGVPSIWAFGGTHDIYSLKFSSTTNRFANFAGLGDSKTQLYYATDFKHRFLTQIDSNSINLAGGGDQLSDILLRMPEVLKLSPAQVLFTAGSNDKRQGFSDAVIEARYDSIVAQLTAANIKVYHAVFPEDSTSGGVGLTGFKNYVAAKYAATYINSWDTLSTGNILKATYQHDAVHFNQSGNDAVYRAIIASGKIKNTLDRTAQIRTTDANLTITGDSLQMAPDIAVRSLTTGTGVTAGINIPRADNGNNAWQLKTNVGDFGLYDVYNSNYRLLFGASSGVSKLQGQIELTGPAGGVLIDSRTDNVNTFGIVSLNRELTINDNVNSAARVTISPIGFMGIGTATPAQKLQVHGKLMVDSLDNGSGTDSVVTVVNGQFKKILQSSIGSGAPTPTSTPTDSSISNYASTAMVAATLGGIVDVEDADYTVPAGVTCVRLFLSNSTARTVTIPAASTMKNNEITVDIVGTSVNFGISSSSNFFLGPSSLGTIGTSFAGNAQKVIRLKSNGTNWYLISQ